MSPVVTYTPGAIRDLQRLRELLRPKNPVAAKRAGEAIMRALQLLSYQSAIGRPVEDLPEEYREWPIDFGGSGYVVRYRIDVDLITVLAVRHQKEAGHLN